MNLEFKILFQFIDSKATNEQSDARTQVPAYVHVRTHEKSCPLRHGYIYAHSLEHCMRLWFVYNWILNSADKLTFVLPIFVLEISNVVIKEAL